MLLMQVAADVGIVAIVARFPKFFILCKVQGDADADGSIMMMVMTL